jgi:hypothetical protein
VKPRVRHNKTDAAHGAYEHVRLMGRGTKRFSSEPAERSFPRQQAVDMSAPETIAALQDSLTRGPVQTCVKTSQGRSGVSDFRDLRSRRAREKRVNRRSAQRYRVSYRVFARPRRRAGLQGTPREGPGSVAKSSFNKKRSYASPRPEHEFVGASAAHREGQFGNSFGVGTESRI